MNNCYRNPAVYLPTHLTTSVTTNATNRTYALCTQCTKTAPLLDFLILDGSKKRVLCFTLKQNTLCASVQFESNYNMSSKVKKD
jgi:hypothetical protein